MLLIGKVIVRTKCTLHLLRDKLDACTLLLNTREEDRNLVHRGKLQVWQLQEHCRIVRTVRS